MNEKLSLILTTVNSKEKDEEIKEHLLKEKLAACISSIEKVSSSYIWEGKVVNESEILLLIKTSGEKEKETIKRLNELHPYETPEILTFTPESVDEKYLNWLIDSLK